MTKLVRSLIAKARALTLLNATLSLLTALVVLQLIGFFLQEREILALRAEINAIYRANAEQYAQQHRDARKMIIVPAQPKESY